MKERFIQVEHQGMIYIYREALAEKTYIKNPADAPRGAAVKQGPKGGYYYDNGLSKQKPTQLTPEAQQIFDKMKEPEEARNKGKGQCQTAAAMFADYYRSQGRNDFKVHSFHVQGVGADGKGANHVVFEIDGNYYDPTASQWGLTPKIFTKGTIPKEYEYKGEVNKDFYTFDKLKLSGKLTKDNFKFGQKIGAFKLYTDLLEFDADLKHIDDPQREYDFEIEWKSPDDALWEQFIQSGDFKKHGKDSYNSWIEFAKNSPNIERFVKKLRGDYTGTSRAGHYKGEPLPIIVTEYNKDNKLMDFQEGRTRALASKIVGLRQIPILKAIHRRLK